MTHRARIFGVLLITWATACGGGAAKPDGGYANMCGPVSADAGPHANTLLPVIIKDTTLTKACSPYYFEGNVLVEANLTIEPGVKLIGPQGGKRSRFTITRVGSLNATGTKADPITFTSRYVDTVPGGTQGGQWTGILFLNALPHSHLENVTIEFAGGPYMRMPGDDEFQVYEFPVNASLENDSTPDVEVVDVTIQHGNGYGVAATTDDMFDKAGADGKSSKNIFSVFDGVTFTSDLMGMFLPVDQVGTLGPNLCWGTRDMAGACTPVSPAPTGVYVEATSDNLLGRTPENITKDATWKAFTVPYKVDNVNVTNNAVLEVLDGATLLMTEVGGITVGLNDPGALKMIGATQGITVTSFYPTPTPSKYWNGIILWDKTVSASSHLENVTVSYGGRRSPDNNYASADIEIVDSSPTIVGNHVSHSLGLGIFYSCAAAPPGITDPPLPDTNTTDDASIICAAAAKVGKGESQNCEGVCPQTTACMMKCPPSGF